MSEFFLELFTEEAPAFSQKNLRENLLKKFEKFFDENDINCLVYLKGNHLLNSGTGFYNKVGNEFVLNTHVGFKENRAIIFDSKIRHCSLQFNENTDSRFVMANFFNYEV